MIIIDGLTFVLGVLGFFLSVFMTAYCYRRIKASRAPKATWVRPVFTNWIWIETSTDPHSIVKEIALQAVGIMADNVCSTRLCSSDIGFGLHCDSKMISVTVYDEGRRDAVFEFKFHSRRDNPIIVGGMYSLSRSIASEMNKILSVGQPHELILLLAEERLARRTK